MKQPQGPYRLVEECPEGYITLPLPAKWDEVKNRYVLCDMQEIRDAAKRGTQG